ncbi:hypothetical protein OG394_23335 [Kribbella sp. NBC_01245]|uniref:hypothetical protein n=1 Tax=Kribbella sp. NBC_01245 TaxID=2903578 RepID=UPI002E2C060C|nr:hypothetical protein [Kribbella sp. NBC_01245]
MHPQNHLSGHAQILARYAGLSEIHPPRIRGRLQFDWADLGPDEPHDWHFVWSGAARRRGLAMGRRHQFVIGAPWLYLMDVQKAEPVQRVGTLWFPEGDPEKLIPEIRATESGPVTISLDPSTPAGVRAAYKQAGFTLIDRRWSFDESVDYDRLGGGPLPSLLIAMRRHQRVASDQMGTPILYGIAAGCEPAVYGGSSSGSSPLDGAQIDPAVAREIADHELGRASMVPPGELRRLFDWRERV